VDQAGGVQQADDALAGEIHLHQVLQLEGRFPEKVFAALVRQHQQAPVDEPLQQGFTGGIHEPGKQEKPGHQDEGGPTDQTAQRFHAEASGSSSMYPAPRTVAIKGGE